MTWTDSIAWLSTKAPLTLELFLELALRPPEPAELLRGLPECPLRAFLESHSHWRNEAAAIFDWCERQGIRVTHPLADDYPAQLLAMEKPPLFLHYRGTACWLKGPWVSVVGSRAPSERCLEWMDFHLGEFLADTPCGIVSGAARGVDQKAHALCIRRGRPTVAFIPAGLDRIYPAVFRSWVPAIVDSGGSVISCFAPHENMWRGHFETRNELIVRMGSLVLVAEARRASGSMMTARLALEAGTTVAVLPSFPGEVGSAGTLDLLFAGASPIRDGADLKSLFDLELPGLANKVKAGDTEEGVGEPEGVLS